jgi:hypothetical protein
VTSQCRPVAAVASVATAFPSGRASLNVKLLDVREAVGRRRRDRHGDRPRGVPLRRLGQVFDEIVAVKEACGDAHLKVILETGELVTYDNVRTRQLDRDARRRRLHQDLDGQGDGERRRLPVALVMLEAVRDFAERRGAPSASRSPAGSAPARTRSATWCSSTRRSARLADARALPLRRVQLLNDLLMQRPSSSGRLRARRRLQRGLMSDDNSPTHNSGRRSSTPRRPSRPPSRGSPSYGLFIDGEFTDPADGTSTFATVNPATEEPLAEVACAGAGRRRPRGRERRGAPATRWVRCPARALEVPLPDRAADPGARARAGGRRDARRRQADPRVARRRRPARRGALLLLRRLGRQARLRRRSAARWRRSASPARSSRGTSRC